MADIEGMTGLNPVKSKQEIEELNTMLSGIQKTFVSNTQDFLSNLREVWYSPRAKEFSQSMGASLNEVDEEIKKNATSIIEDACGAFNDLAVSHGVMKIDVAPGEFTIEEYPNCEEQDFSGNVGMKAEKVKEATDEYLQNLDKINQILQEMPRTISFYDEGGSIADSYTSRIERIKTTLNESIEFINNKVAQAITEQEELAQEGSSNAQDILSNG